MGKPARVLFICGSLNQTTQLEQVAAELGAHRSAFTPYYGGRFLDYCRRLGLLETTIAGNKLRERCLEYLSGRGLPIDVMGGAGPYDLYVTCSDIVVPPGLPGPLVVVQEGILDPPNALFPIVRRYPMLVPRWLAGTRATGLSAAYERFCVASSGYERLFSELGAPREKLVVTGIPNFDDCARYRKNSFPYEGYVLVCTSDARETFKLDDRRAFIRKAVTIADGRPLFFKLHPNENAPRAIAEIRKLAPAARVFTSGSAEEMVANAQVLITQYSSLAFVGVALGKEVHSYFAHDELKRLLPQQNGEAARRIADVCRSVLARARRAPGAARTAAGPSGSSRVRPAAYQESRP